MRGGKVSITYTQHPIAPPQQPITRLFPSLLLTFDDSIVAPEGNLKPPPQGKTVNRRHHRYLGGRAETKKKRITRMLACVTCRYSKVLVVLLVRVGVLVCIYVHTTPHRIT